MIKENVSIIKCICKTERKEILKHDKRKPNVIMNEVITKKDREGK